MAWNVLEHLRASQIGMYLRCPPFRYIEGLKVRPSGAMKLSGVVRLAEEALMARGFRLDNRIRS